MYLLVGSVAVVVIIVLFSVVFSCFDLVFLKEVSVRFVVVKKCRESVLKIIVFG